MLQTVFLSQDKEEGMFPVAVPQIKYLELMVLLVQLHLHLKTLMATLYPIKLFDYMHNFMKEK